MTLDEVKLLSDDDLRTRVAELCGIRAVREPTDIEAKLGYDLMGYRDGSTTVCCVPYYPGDLKAMHGAESVIEANHLLLDYSSDLLEVSDTNDPDPFNANYHMFHVTARQKAEAFVITLTRPEK